MKITRLSSEQDLVQCPTCGAHYVCEDIADGEYYKCESCGVHFVPVENIKVFGDY